MSTTLHAKLRDAGPLKPAIVATPAVPQPVVARVAIESLPPVTIAELPTPRAWVHRIERDGTGAMVAVYSVPVEAAP